MVSEPLNLARRTRILIVEDDELQMQVLQAGLASLGFDVETVSNGLEAVWQVNAVAIARMLAMHSAMAPAPKSNRERRTSTGRFRTFSIGFLSTLDA